VRAEFSGVRNASLQQYLGVTSHLKCTYISHLNVRTELQSKYKLKIG
jgi:hypothetical protein